MARKSITSAEFQRRCCIGLGPPCCTHDRGVMGSPDSARCGSIAGAVTSLEAARTALASPSGAENAIWRSGDDAKHYPYNQNSGSPRAGTNGGSPSSDCIMPNAPQPEQPIAVPEPDVVRPPTPLEEPQPEKGPDLPQPGPDVVVPPGPEVITPSQPQEIPPAPPA